MGRNGKYKIVDFEYPRILKRSIKIIDCDDAELMFYCVQQLPSTVYMRSIESIISHRKVGLKTGLVCAAAAAVCVVSALLSFCCVRVAHFLKVLSL